MKYLVKTKNGQKFFTKDISLAYYILFLMEDCNFDTFGVPKYYGDSTEGLSVGENASLIFIQLLSDRKITGELVQDRNVSIQSIAVLRKDSLEARQVFRIIKILTLLIDRSASFDFYCLGTQSVVEQIAY